MGPDTELVTDSSGPPLSRLPRGWLISAAVVPLVLATVLAVVLAIRLGVIHAGIEVGDPAPPIVLADLAGEPLRLSDHAGQPVIVYFWGSWCPSCIDEFPLLEAALVAHQPDGLTVLGVIHRDRSEPAAEFMTNLGATWSSGMDPDEAVAAAYGIYGAPEAFFIDGGGVVRARQIGPFTETDLQEHLATILPAD